MGAASAGGDSLVSVGNSALFNSANSEDLSRGSMSGTATTWTASFWVYRGDNGQRGSATAKMMFTTASDAGLSFGNNSTADVLAWYSGSYTATTAVFRDIGWYHMVVKNVAGTGTVYVNGESVLTGLTVPTADATMAIGSYNNSSSYLDGYMAEWVFIDGTALEPTSFAEYDSTGTFWTPLSSATIKALTFGTNGFYLDNTTNAQTDASGEGNNFTNNNTVVTDTHTPTNIEFLMSPINVTDPSDNPVLTNGNRTWSASSSSAQTRMGGNIPFPSSGKWIAGVIITELSDGKAFGIWSDRTDGDGFPSVGGFSGWHRTSVLVAYESDGSTVLSDTNWPQGTTQAVGDQCWIAVDIDNSKTFFGYYDLSADAILWYANDAGNDGNPATGDNPFEENFNCAGMVWAGAAQNSKSFTLVKEADCPFTIPTGYSFLSTTNLAANITRTHSNLEEYFSTTLYEGNGAGQRVGKFLPFTNTFTVGNSALFVNANSEDLSRGSMSGTATTFTISMWVKRTHPAVGSATANFMFTTASDAGLGFGNNSTADVLAWYSGSYTSTTRVFEDQSQWMNVVFKSSSGTGTAYVNGVEMLSSLTVNGADATMAIGSYNNSSNFFDGYMAEVVMMMVLL